MQHVSLVLGAVTVAAVAGVQQVTVGMFVFLLQGVEFVQHFVFVIVAFVYYYFEVTYLEFTLVMFVHMVQSSLEMILSPLCCHLCDVVCWVILVFLVLMQLMVQPGVWV